MKEENIVSGAIKSPFDERDANYIYESLGLAKTPFDWSIGYDIEKVAGLLKTKNQGSSGSCGGQAWAYFMACLDTDMKEKSAKFIYAHTFVLPAGSAGRTNCQLCHDKGVSDEELCPSYDNGATPSEAFMQNKSDISSEAYKNAQLDKIYSYSPVIDFSWDNIAQAIRENKGVVLGVYGQNNGTWLSKFPKAPTIAHNQCWAHWLYAGKAVMIDGKKYIGVKNSWGDVGEDGWQYLGEEYATHLFEVWTEVYNYHVKYQFTKFMKLGSRGYEVKQLQRVLGIGMDGIFGPRTLNEVKEFQKEHNLVVDGIVGPKTLSVLNSL